MKVFVIGGTGLIGSHAACALVAAGHEVASLARSPEAEAELAAWGITPISGDAANYDAIGQGVDWAETVVFTAALGESENVLVEWLLDRLAGSGKSLVFCSGTGILGQRTGGDWSEDTFAEWDEFVPSRALGVRVDLETRVRSASTAGLGRGMVVRPPAVWSHEKPHALVIGVLDSVRKTGAACHIGSGLNMYSHVHAEDLGELFRHVVERGQDGAVYHAVGGEVPNRWIAQMISGLTGRPTRSISMDEGIELWGKFQTLIVFGVSSRSRSPRSRSEFGWMPRHQDMLAAAEVSVRKLLADDPL